jgi:hypothetical protein
MLYQLSYAHRSRLSLSRVAQLLHRATSLLLLLHNLIRLRRYNLGLLSMTRDLPVYAHLRVLIFRVGRTELRAAAPRLFDLLRGKWDSHPTTGKDA